MVCILFCEAQGLHSNAWRCQQVRGRAVAFSSIVNLALMNFSCVCLLTSICPVDAACSGKSTMVGVLTRSMLDDGRGLARSKVCGRDTKQFWEG